jgi:hypothetical protein
MLRCDTLSAISLLTKDRSMPGKDDVDDDGFEEVLTPLTGDDQTDHRNLIVDAIVSVVSSCPDDRADPFVRNWLERAKFLGLYSGPTEGKIETILEWLDDNVEEE